MSNRMAESWMQRWWIRRAAQQDRKTLTTGATTLLLHHVVADCMACGQSFHGHTWRFFSCHPASSASAFLAAAERGDWPAVQASQLPAIDQPLYVVYAIACPETVDSAGMVAVLLFGSVGHQQNGLQASKPQPNRYQANHTSPGHLPKAQLQSVQSIAPDDFADLRDLCPTCPWIPFPPALQSGKEAV